MPTLIENFKNEVSRYKIILEEYRDNTQSINSETLEQINMLLRIMNEVINTDFDSDYAENLLNHSNNFSVVEAAILNFINPYPNIRLSLDDAISYMSPTSMAYNPAFAEAIEYLNQITSANSYNSNYSTYYMPHIR